MILLSPLSLVFVSHSLPIRFAHMAVFIAQHTNIKAHAATKIVVAHSAPKVAKIFRGVNTPRSEVHTFSFWKLSDSLDEEPVTVPAIVIFFDSLDEMNEMAEDAGLDAGDMTELAQKLFSKSAAEFSARFDEDETEIESGFIYFLSIDGRNTSRCFTFEEFGAYIISEFFPIPEEKEKSRKKKK